MHASSVTPLTRWVDAGGGGACEAGVFADVAARLDFAGAVAPRIARISVAAEADLHADVPGPAESAVSEVNGRVAFKGEVADADDAAVGHVEGGGEVEGAARQVPIADEVGGAVGEVEDSGEVHELGVHRTDGGAIEQLQVGPQCGNVGVIPIVREV